MDWKEVRTVTDRDNGLKYIAVPDLLAWLKERRDHIGKVLETATTPEILRHQEVQKELTLLMESLALME